MTSKSGSMANLPPPWQNGFRPVLEVRRCGFCVGWYFGLFPLLLHLPFSPLCPHYLNAMNLGQIFCCIFGAVVAARHICSCLSVQIITVQIMNRYTYNNSFKLSKESIEVKAWIPSPVSLCATETLNTCPWSNLSMSYTFSGVEISANRLSLVQRIGIDFAWLSYLCTNFVDLCCTGNIEI